MEVLTLSNEYAPAAGKALATMRLRREEPSLLKRIRWCCSRLTDSPSSRYSSPARAGPSEEEYVQATVYLQPLQLRPIVRNLLDVLPGGTVGRA
jgi:hypothetical protein